jgi:hypothetical protein
MALTLANRTIPSSCLSLITLSPRPGGTVPPVMLGVETPLLTNFQPLKIYISTQQQLVIPFGFGPDRLQFRFTSTKVVQVS